VGKVKAAIGSAIGRDALEREGRLQQAQSETELEAERSAAQAAQEEQRGGARDTAAAMDNYLKLVRWPLDTATRLLPGSGWARGRRPGSASTAST
jgi:uncharacterized protein YjbJ (UPF0337 family)